MIAIRKLREFVGLAPFVRAKLSSDSPSWDRTATGKQASQRVEDKVSVQMGLVDQVGIG